MKEEINKACKILLEGGIILYPTDTIWGIGCDATNEDAVKKVYEIKKRADAKAMLVMIDSPSKLAYYVDEVLPIAYDLIEVADKPLTIIYPHAKNVAVNLIAPDGTLGIRITKEEFSNQLCRQLNRPLVSTSANFSGEAPPLDFSGINPAIIDRMDYVVKYRQNEKGISKASGILRLGARGEITIIRE